jgi:hypothetical protein
VAHAVQTELLAVEQVSGEVQLSICVQGPQTSAGPLWSRKYPASQLVHCEVVAEAQVSGEVQ